MDIRTGRKKPAQARLSLSGSLAIVMVILAPALSAQHAMPMEMPVMTSALFPGLPMAREGSGTSWQPDSSPIFAWHAPPGSWTLMVHGAVFLRYTDQDAGRAGTRGGRMVDAPNWVMVMAQPPHGGKGGFSFRGMFSLDRLTEGGDGYPLLFQSGETWKGEPLVDRQHPHDLVSELSVSYGRSLGRAAGVFLYFGLPGEPALGPPAFMHRASALNNPDAPLGHHLQDSTHITFGVLTAGVWHGKLKIDTSIFTGREPGENRFAFDRPRFDSWAVRLAVNPSAHVAFQVSHGFLNSPESGKPQVDVRRTTASLSVNRQPTPGTDWLTTLVWGMNQPSQGPATHSLLLDSEAGFKRSSVYGRLEFVQREAHDLKLDELGERVLPVTSLTIGAARRVGALPGLLLHAGAQVSLYHVVTDLATAYGRRPFSLEVYLRLGLPRVSGMAPMHH